MDRYICIHGHFYQPPRENPWLEAVPLQDSAYPYHDWNARITAECYAPNSASRILDGEGRIADIMNNYGWISFNFGPTLLAWLESKVPEVYRAILTADKESHERFSGHGSGVAQAYNHMILPLANTRDKRTQLIWGVRDFESRFGRQPEGLWLPETAVDLESLDIMAELGVKYTILSPFQATRVRPLDREPAARAVKAEGDGKPKESREGEAKDEGWKDVPGGQIDPTTVYLQHLPSGRTIDIFFYDGPISRGIAFEGMLNSGDNFANRLLGAFNDDRQWPQLVHIATDGETYGHHKAHGDMALAYALCHIDANNLAKLTNYGEYLSRYEPTHEVEITENTAWSCSHGVERWRSNCGCSTGGQPGWTQEWRLPLRNALDWLRDTVAPLYEKKAAKFVKDPWAARDDYVDVILDRAKVDDFVAKHGTHELSQEECVTLLQLMELQRHAMLMYTSCGWFFSELSGIETVQVIMYAGRVVQLAQELFEQGSEIESGFLDRLAEAKSNIPEHGDGRVIYDKWVKPAIVDLARVGAHYAMSSLFEAYPEKAHIYSYDVERDDYTSLESGPTRLVAGNVRIASDITLNAKELSFGFLYMGGYIATGGVRPFQGDEAYQAMRDEITEPFKANDVPEVIRRLDKHFSELRYSFKSLFHDEQRRIIGLILQPSLAETEMLYNDVYQRQAPLIQALRELNVPVPPGFHAAAEVSLNTRLRQAFESTDLDRDQIQSLLEQTRKMGVTLDVAGLGYTVSQAVERIAEQFVAEPASLAAVRRFAVAAEVARAMPFEVNLWRPQNIYFNAREAFYPGYAQAARGGDDTAIEWVQTFATLGDKLGFEVPAVEPAAT